MNNKEKLKIKTKNKVKVFYVDAVNIALKTKKQKPNTAMLGALAKAFGKLPMKHVKTAMEEEGLQEMYIVEEGFKTLKR